MLENTTEVPFSFVGCNNATQKVCAAISGTTSYVTDFATKFNETCGPFMPTNATLVLTASALMDGITVLVGGPANVVGGPSTYLKAGLMVAYCGHETLKNTVPGYDTGSALIGAGATVAAFAATGFGLWAIAKGHKKCKERKAARNNVYASSHETHEPAPLSGEEDALLGGGSKGYSKLGK